MRRHDDSFTELGGYKDWISEPFKGGQGGWAILLTVFAVRTPNKNTLPAKVDQNCSVIEINPTTSVGKYKEIKSSH